MLVLVIDVIMIYFLNAIFFDFILSLSLLAYVFLFL